LDCTGREVSVAVGRYVVINGLIWHEILSVNYPGPEQRDQRIGLAVRFPLLVERIVRDAVERSGPEVNVP
jgi:hypothetical protein